MFSESRFLYDRQKILEQLADILNSSVPEHNKFFKTKFSAENGRSMLFFVYDLTDPSNKSSYTKTCIDFKNNHTYHFAPTDSMFSFSHILILEDGKLKIFKSINCQDRRGDKLEDVLSYLDKKMKDDKNREEIIQRVKSYRKYGFYSYGDEPEIRCTEINL